MFIPSPFVKNRWTEYVKGVVWRQANILWDSRWNMFKDKVLRSREALRRVIASLLLLALLSADSLVAQEQSQQGEKKIGLTAREILGRMDQALEVEVPFKRSKLSYVHPSGNARPYIVKIYHKGEHLLYKFESVNGRLLEKVLYRDNGEKIWVYDDSGTLFHKQGIDRYRPLLQTDFYYFDLGNFKYRANFNATILGQEKYKKLDCYKLELRPLFRSPVYGMLTVWVSQETFLPLRVDFHNSNMTVQKSLRTVSVRKQPEKNKYIIEKRQMLNVTEGTITILEHLYYDRDKKLDKSMFDHDKMQNQ